MTVMGRLAAAGRALFAPQANTITTSEDLDKTWLRFGTESASGQIVTDTTAMGLSAVYACVRVLSQTVSHLPLVLYRHAGDTRLPAESDKRFLLLKERPNEWQTSLEFRELLQKDVELRGNGYAYIVRGVGGVAVELIRMHPDCVAVDQDAATLALKYTYTRKDGKRTELERRNVFHLRGMGDDGVTGISPVRQHRNTIGDALGLQTHGSKFFKNGARPSGVLDQEAGTKLSPESKKSLKEDFDDAYSGAENAFKTLILPGGVTYKPLSISMEDAQYIESRKLSVSEIARIYGVPPHKIGDLEKATFSNIEHQALEFVVDAIVPRVTRWEQAIKRDLLAEDQNLYAKHNLSALLRGDAKSRAEALQIQRRNGVINANEWRELEDMNPRTDDGGDGYIVEANMRPDDGSDPLAGRNQNEPSQTP